MKQHQEVTDKRIDEVFRRLDADIPPMQDIFYGGQVFDAYRFASDLIRKAKQAVWAESGLGSPLCGTLRQPNLSINQELIRL